MTKEEFSSSFNSSYIYDEFKEKNGVDIIIKKQNKNISFQLINLIS
jgi:hypothetical protein